MWVYSVGVRGVSTATIQRALMLDHCIVYHFMLISVHSVVPSPVRERGGMRG